VYRLTNVTLAKYKAESDSDYHLVISDGNQTMIAEIADPGCVGSASPFSSDAHAARMAFDSKFTAMPFFRDANVTATLEGVGFFDFFHGQTGVAINAFELHPVTAICFGDGCGAPQVDAGSILDAGVDGGISSPPESGPSDGGSPTDGLVGSGSERNGVASEFRQIGCGCASSPTAPLAWVGLLALQILSRRIRSPSGLSSGAESRRILGSAAQPFAKRALES
jgi:MYXO-CTERM domain-containing protein